jgi:5-formyltetrahydrofolate cyclo-ligase
MLSKAELRNLGLTRRDGVPADTRLAFSARLATVGLRLVQEMASDGLRPVVSVYSPIGSEPDIMPLAVALHAAEMPLVLPVDWSHGTPLVYRRWTPGDRLARGPLGIAEPLPDARESDPDILFIPMAAFDRLGQRIGYGAGNIDRTLASLRSRRRIRAIGVAYAVQQELLIPVEPHDEPLDIVVTDRDILVCRY